MCSGLLIASNTRLRGASNRRVSWMSRSDGVVTLKLSLFATRFTAISLLLRFELPQVGIEAIETLFPDRAVALGPRGDFLERSRLEPAGPPLGLASTRDQARPFEHPQMLRDRGQTDLERSGQLGDRALPRDESRENRAAGGIRQGRERRAQLVWVIWCHLYLTDKLINLIVKYNAARKMSRVFSCSVTVDAPRQLLETGIPRPERHSRAVADRRRFVRRPPAAPRLRHS